MDRPAKIVTVRVPLTNAEGQVMHFTGEYPLTVQQLLQASREQIEARVLTEFAGTVCNLLLTHGALWGTTIGHPDLRWSVAKPAIIVPDGKAVL